MCFVNPLCLPGQFLKTDSPVNLGALFITYNIELHCLDAIGSGFIFFADALGDWNSIKNIKSKTPASGTALYHRRRLFVNL